MTTITASSSVLSNTAVTEMIGISEISTGAIIDIASTLSGAVQSTEDAFTAAANTSSQIFLQTAGAKAIAGVFAFASILVTCVQVKTVNIAHLCDFALSSSLIIECTEWII